MKKKITELILPPLTRQINTYKYLWCSLSSERDDIGAKYLKVAGLMSKPSEVYTRVWVNWWLNMHRQNFSTTERNQFAMLTECRKTP